MPLKLDSVYNEPPFNIVRDSHDRTDKFHRHERGEREVRAPAELRVSRVGLEELCSVRDWKEDRKMDEMKRWELVSPMPTIEYEYDGCKGKKSLYVPSSG